MHLPNIHLGLSNSRQCLAQSRSPSKVSIPGKPLPDCCTRNGEEIGDDARGSQSSLFSDIVNMEAAECDESNSIFIGIQWS